MFVELCFRIPRRSSKSASKRNCGIVFVRRWYRNRCPTTLPPDSHSLDHVNPHTQKSAFERLFIGLHVLSAPCIYCCQCKSDTQHIDRIICTIVYMQVASPLGVTHMLFFSQSSHFHTTLRVGCVPRGPTLQFKVLRALCDAGCFPSLQHRQT